MSISTSDLNSAIGARTQYALGRALERMGFQAAAQEAYQSALMLDSRHRAAWERLRRTREAPVVRAKAVTDAPIIPATDVAAMETGSATGAVRFF